MAVDACILVVEDDDALRRSLVLTLKAAGYRAIEAGSVADASRAIAHHKPTLILLDLGLPDGNGIDFIQQVRTAALTPIVVISARDGEATKVAAFDCGADDYVTKPFGVDELLARIKAGLRHAVQASGSLPIVRTGDLQIDLAARVVCKNEVEVALTPKEYEVLALLALCLGKVVTHRELLRSVWGSERADMQYLRVYIGQLRAKLESGAGPPRLIVSDPGVGYRLKAL